MRRSASLVIFLVLQSLGQSASLSKTEKATIQKAKDTSVRSLDSTLPDVTLEFFLKTEGGGVRISWEVNDCGEQTGNPEMDKDRDFPMCVSAELETKDHRTANVSISVGTSKKGIFGKPELWDVVMTDSDGLVKPVRKLSDLPMELHRVPKRKKGDSWNNGS